MGGEDCRKAPLLNDLSPGNNFSFPRSRWIHALRSLCTPNQQNAGRRGGSFLRRDEKDEPRPRED